ncbi:bifunctional folylpolyglutamate synthase/dihydrofolate synthase [Companilactobacillus halodurans]|uniref:tetrahydrofolate synthase n=1 Tax=Companilactobacillus halodurans TaxID=2584183 RepID=A0A5P0ZW88_9LACO|nr:cyanophycin synthetase [Companilactobacillus halodurans]MQS74964.1 bifunctional folylpolyglutamate synthase/dihydrofolate synthase [Companilactobacillus halodurans]MQS97165.1 bifunctional folylpolyglutamate synthase/dihydrofolate synthase [Companilactobacillus halodurans]
MLEDYQAAIKYIHSLPKFHRTNNLDNIKQALHRLGDPQNSYETIHITGTNGKGTTTNFLANLLESTGQRVGMFTSPFIKEFNERIQINHKYISNADLVDEVNLIKEKVGDIPLAEFEFVTILGYFYFRGRVDVAVIEAGIGAKHDKTNVIVPTVSVITSIDLDHEKLIGPTIQDIAREKAGIIKEKKPIVTGDLHSSVSNIVEKAAQQKESQLFRLGTDFLVKDFKTNNFELSFTYSDSEITITDILCQGFEKTTAMNASIAIKAYELYQKAHHQEVLSQSVKQGLDSHKLPGRAQIVQKNPLILMDGAHNISAIYNLINSLSKTYENKDIIVLYAGMKDKDRHEILEELAPKAKQIYITKLNMMRSATASDYNLSEYKNVSFIENYHKQLQKIINDLTADQILLITGSFYLVSELENYFS